MSQTDTQTLCFWIKSCLFMASGKREHKPASVTLKKSRRWLQHFLYSCFISLFPLSLECWHVSHTEEKLQHFTCSLRHYTGSPWPQAKWTQLARGERFKPGVKSGYHRSLLLHSHGWVHIASSLALIKPKVAIKKPDELQTTAVAVVLYFMWNGSIDTSWSVSLNLHFKSVFDGGD